ncbi:MAG TPA: hypothetical protein VF503_06305 [Sphingobium sp.]|uniref:hypothetical protein n=1 Tax=Sphingobium sp. TaxID=1912891 RepID=UPI002ED2B7AA
MGRITDSMTMRPFRFTPLLAPLLAPMLALAPGLIAPLHASEPDERIQALVVYGNDVCPQSDDGTIVVCARKPESERYRIPKELRDKARKDKMLEVGGQGWANNVQSLEAAGQVLLPNSCSAIGANGFGGCSLAALHQWYAERQMDGNAPTSK